MQMGQKKHIKLAFSPSLILFIYCGKVRAPFLQGKEWRVPSQSSDAGRPPGDFQGKRCRPQSGVRQLRGAGCAGREVVSFEPPGRLAGDFLF